MNQSTGSVHELVDEIVGPAPHTFLVRVTRLYIMACKAAEQADREKRLLGSLANYSQAQSLADVMVELLAGEPEAAQWTERSRRHERSVQLVIKDIHHRVEDVLV